MTIPQELASIRKSIEAESVSHGELARLAELIPHIPKDDVLLLEWAGVLEFPCEHDKPYYNYGSPCGNCGKQLP